MPALIGYLVTLVIFLGGGYAGMQWLTAPEYLPSAVAVHRSVTSVKSTRARLLARKRHEAAAEREANAKPDVTTTPPAQEDAAPPIVETVAETVAAEPATASEPAQPNAARQSASVADKPLAEAPFTARAAAIAGGKTTIAASVQPDTPLGSRPTATPGIPASAPVPLPSAQNGKPKPIEKNAARPVLARDSDEAPDTRRATATKRRAMTRLASRKPVLMILRTIEFPDGRREQRLLPMPRYRQAFADN